MPDTQFEPSRSKRITGQRNYLKDLKQGEYFTTIRSPSHVAEMYLITSNYARYEVCFALSTSSGKLHELKYETSEGAKTLIYEYVPSKELEIEMLIYTT